MSFKASIVVIQFYCMVISTTNNKVKNSYTFTQSLISNTVSRTAYATIQDRTFTEASNPCVLPQGCTNTQDAHIENTSIH